MLASLLALALTRYDFFGEARSSLLVILPIALPGIVTGIALQSVIQNLLNPVFGINAGLFTIIVGHATFCIVVVFNNVARPAAAAWAGRWRPRRPTSAPGHSQTLRLVTFPLLRTALVAGALLAFGLSFDEIVVTTFTAGPGTPDPADLDLQQPVPAQPGAGRQRRRRGPGG